MERGKKNGVKNLKLIDRQELRKKEPFIHPKATKALFSPDAGTLIPYELAIALFENAVDNGAEIRTRRQVVNIEQGPGNPKFRIKAKYYKPITLISFFSPSNIYFFAPFIVILFLITEQLSLNLLGIISSIYLLFVFLLSQLFWRMTTPLHIYEPSKGTFCYGIVKTEIIKTNYIVNASGCEADKIAHLVNDYSFKIIPRRGDYILLDKKEGHKANHVIFPVPNPKTGKGVLVQTTLWGNLIIGPTSRNLLNFDSATEKWKENFREISRNNNDIIGELLVKARQIIPNLDASKIIHTFSGDRAKSTRNDWIIEPCSTAPQMIHAVGIDSPGIAGSPAIALEIVRLLKEAGAPVNEFKRNFNSNRSPIIIPKQGFKGLKMGKEGKFLNPKENVVCKCERVTEGEVIDACHRLLSIESTQAIRKRTRAGMGHCQGDPHNYNCEERVKNIIEKETGLQNIGLRQWPASSLLPQRWLSEKQKAYFNEISE